MRFGQHIGTVFGPSCNNFADCGHDLTFGADDLPWFFRSHAKGVRGFSRSVFAHHYYGNFQCTCWPPISKLVVRLVMLGSVFLLSACENALSVTEAEWAACDEKVTELLNVEAKGKGSLLNLRNTNGTKSIRILYQDLAPNLGVQCDLVAGKVVSVVEFKQLFPNRGDPV